LLLLLLLPPSTPERKSLFHYSLSLNDVHFGVSISSLSFFPAIFSVDDSPAEKNSTNPTNLSSRSYRCAQIPKQHLLSSNATQSDEG
jgi:hypothetical protein